MTIANYLRNTGAFIFFTDYFHMEYYMNTVIGGYLC